LAVKKHGAGKRVSRPEGERFDFIGVHL